MEEKKEIQRKILNETPNLKATEDELFSILKIISPGTHFRSALDGALKIGKGALIVIENSSLMPLIDGGFRLNAKFSPQRLMGFFTKRLDFSLSLFYYKGRR